MNAPTDRWTLAQIAAADLCTSCAQMGPLVRGKWKDRTLPADVVATLPRSAKELGTHLCRGCCGRLAAILDGPNARILRAKLAASA